jgi:hypothetical protein
MAGWTIHDIADPRLYVTRPMPALPAPLEAAIDRLWDAAQARTGGALFNGRVFSADVITRHLVCGHWTEFRRIVAQMARPDLHAALGIRPLAVGGVLHGPDGVVFGRRPARAVYQAGEWQLPPAGSLDPTALRAGGRVDFVAQVLAELREEVGLEAADIDDIRPLAIVEHARAGHGSHVLDLGIGLRTRLAAAEIQARHAAHGNGEYAPPLTIIPVAGLPAFLAAGGPLVNLQAPVFLRHLGLIA